MLTSFQLHGLRRLKAKVRARTACVITPADDSFPSITLFFDSKTEALAYADAINGTTEALDEADKMQEPKLEAVA